MANKDYKVGILITGDSRGGVKALELTEEKAKKLSTTQQRGARVNRQYASSFNGLKSSLGGVLSVFALASFAKQAISTIDSLTNMEARLRLISSSNAEFEKSLQGVVNIAQQTGQQLDGVGEVYARLGRATQALGVTQGELETVTRAVTQAVVVSGASATEAEAAMIQLSQGLAAGALRGDELRSVLEQTPRLAQAIADGMGVAVGQLREMGKQGLLTAETVVEALKSQAGVISGEFSQMPVTVERAWTTLTNAVSLFVQSADKSLGITQKLARDFTTLADAITHATKSYEGFYTLQGKYGNQIDLATERMAAVRLEMQTLANQTTPYAIQRLKTLGAEYNLLTKSIADNTQKIDEQNKKETEATATTTKNTVATVANTASKKELSAAIKQNNKEFDELLKELDAEEAALFKVRKATFDYNKEHQDSIRVAKIRITQGELAARKEEEWIAAQEKGIEVTRSQSDGYVTAGYELEKLQEQTEKAGEQAKIYSDIVENMVENIQREFGDLVYGALWEDGISSFSDFTDSLVDLFKKAIAEMIAAWLTSGIVGMLSGQGFGGFSIANLGGSIASAFGGTGSIASGIGGLINGGGIGGATGGGGILGSLSGLFSGGGAVSGGGLLGPTIGAGATAGAGAAALPAAPPVLSGGGGLAGMSTSMGTLAGYAGAAYVAVETLTTLFTDSPMEIAIEAAKNEFAELNENMMLGGQQMQTLGEGVTSFGEANNAVWAGLDTGLETFTQRGDVAISSFEALEQALENAGVKVQHFGTQGGQAMYKLSGNIGAAKDIIAQFGQQGQSSLQGVVNFTDLAGNSYEQLKSIVSGMGGVVSNVEGAWGQYSGTVTGSIAQMIALQNAFGTSISGSISRANSLAGAMSSIPAAPSINAANINGSHADGLNYVPFDGYLAELHKGERVLTAREAKQRDAGNSAASSAPGLVTAIERLEDRMRAMENIGAAQLAALQSRVDQGERSLIIERAGVRR